MLLAVDIGNTNIVMGIFDNGSLAGRWRLRSQRNLTEDEIHVFLYNAFLAKGFTYNDVSGVIISCVVPPLSQSLEKFCEKYLGRSPYWVDASSVPDMPLLVDDPHSVGADRIVNAVAAFHKYRSSLIVVDFGTATTIDYISESGSYLGGTISPGLKISSDALFQKTSLLPRMERFTLPDTVVAKNTISSMNAGIIYGYAGLVDGIVRRAKQEIDPNPKVVATGGLAPLIAEVADTIDIVEPNFTLEGLWIIYEKRGNKAAEA
jgi:type III pantothenate kinase